MRPFLRVVAALVGCLPVGTSQAIDFPPLGDRYANIPEDAEEAYKSLKRLEARTEIGVNYLEYNRTIGDTFPDVKLFLESREAKNLPELAFVLDNAMDCYVEVNRLWGLKVGSGSAIEKYDASMTLITAQPMLWRVAATNLSGAKAILQSEPGELEAAQKLIAAGGDSLTLEGALQAAIDEEIRLSRASRAKETGCPVPPEVGGPGLLEQLFPGGKIDETFAVGAMTKRLTRIFDKVPPASREGSVDVLKDGERQGIVTVFRYNDLETATKAFDALSRNLGSDRKPHARLGNLAAVTDRAGVFRRGNVAVYTQGSLPQAAMLAMLTAIDRRVAAEFGEGQDVEIPAPASPEVPAPPPLAVESRPMPSEPRPAVVPELRPVEDDVETAQSDDLAALLLVDGDLGKAVEPGDFQERRHAEFDSLPPSATGGMYVLKAAGAAFGTVAALEYDDLEAARDIFTAWTSKPRSAAKISRVSGLGAKSYRRETRFAVEFFFFRDRYLLYISGPPSSEKELVRLGRRIDARIREARSAAKDESTLESDE